MRLSLPTLSVLLLSLVLPGCQSDYSSISDKVVPQPPPEVKKDPEKKPLQYRIKRIVYEGNWAIGTTTELTYGSDGKVSQARYVGLDAGRGAPKGLFTYNASGQLATYDYLYPYADSQGHTSERTAFSYSPQNTGTGQPAVTMLFAQTDLIKPDGTHQLLKHTTSELVSGLVRTVRTEAATIGSTATTDEYTFNAGNLTTIRTVVGQDQHEAYSYDDKPNPFSGLFGPDITPVRRYSRNNVTEATVWYPSGSVRTYTINYTYNEQGLPITAQTSETASGRILFEYEAY